MANPIPLHAAGPKDIVALHGSAAAPAQWRALARDAAGSFHVHAWDLPGYGAPANPGRGLDRRAAPVIAQVEALGRPVHLVGHSFGGAIALKIALLRPDLVASLCLYESAMFQLLTQSPSTTERQALRELKAVDARLTAAIGTGHVQDGMAQFVDFWNGTSDWRTMPQDRRQILAGQAVNVMTDFTDAWADTTSLSQLRSLGVPTLLLSGTNSPTVSQVLTTRLLGVLPDAVHVGLNDLGHMAPITAPERVNPWILAHASSANHARAAGSSDLRNAA